MLRFTSLPTEGCAHHTAPRPATAGNYWRLSKGLIPITSKRDRVGLQGLRGVTAAQHRVTKRSGGGAQKLAARTIARQGQKTIQVKKDEQGVYAAKDGVLAGKARELPVNVQRRLPALQHGCWQAASAAGKLLLTLPVLRGSPARGWSRAAAAGPPAAQVGAGCAAGVPSCWESGKGACCASWHAARRRRTPACTPAAATPPALQPSAPQRWGWSVPQQPQACSAAARRQPACRRSPRIRALGRADADGMSTAKQAGEARAGRSHVASGKGVSGACRARGPAREEDGEHKALPCSRAGARGRASMTASHALVCRSCARLEPASQRVGRGPLTVGVHHPVHRKHGVPLRHTP